MPAEHLEWIVSWPPRTGACRCGNPALGEAKRRLGEDVPSRDKLSPEREPRFAGTFRAPLSRQRPAASGPPSCPKWFQPPSLGSLCGPQETRAADFWSLPECTSPRKSWVFLGSAAPPRATHPGGHPRRPDHPPRPGRLSPPPSSASVTVCYRWAWGHTCRCSRHTWAERAPAATSGSRRQPSLLAWFNSILLVVLPGIS